MVVRTNRRAFLKTAALAGAAGAMAGTVSAARKARKTPLVKPVSPNEKLNIAIIGVWGRGRANLGGVRGENIAALCDVSAVNLARQAKAFPRAKQYKDWRKALEQKDLDAVVISTADHHHALCAVAAMKRDLSVYCEKPLGHTVQEARLVRETYVARRDKIATQMGTQIHATENYRRVVELVQAGAIGPVREAHVWCSRRGPGGGLPKGAQPVPATLDWDIWLGPAPHRGYNGKYLPGNLTWNRYWDFGNGTLGDMGSHLIDLPFWALGLRQPLTVEAKGDPTPPSPHTCSKWLVCTWEHPARGDAPPVKLTWYDGVKMPKSPPGYDLAKNKFRGIGVMFVGDGGTLVADYGKHVLLPREKFKTFRRPEKKIPKSRGHHQEWIHGCKTSAPTLCNFDYSGMLIENNLLGNVAFRVGKKLQWDPKNLKAVGCPEADKLIRKTYRQGWDITTL